MLTVRRPHQKIVDGFPREIELNYRVCIFIFTLPTPQKIHMVYSTLLIRRTFYTCCTLLFNANISCPNVPRALSLDFLDKGEVTFQS